jgi:hypothetical protein
MGPAAGLSVCLSVCLSIYLWLYSPLLDLGCFSSFLILYMPVTVAERSEAWTVFTRSDAGIVGSNPTEAWMFV